MHRSPFAPLHSAPTDGHAPTVEAPPTSLGALAAGVSLSLLSGLAVAQATGTEAALPEVRVQGSVQNAAPAAKQTYKADTTRIGKGTQALRDIPQSVTVVTEKLMADRNLDDLKEVLRTTAGVTFLAGETGEEDVRLRGFSLVQSGDLYIDGMRDPSLYERDTFNYDRVEVLKGSASMLFGKGSTGGVVNQVSKQPFLMDSHEVNLSVGSGKETRATGDFNLQTGSDSALRINAMTQEGNNHGAKTSKRGVAPTYRWGIGTRDEFSVGLFHLEYNNNPIYNHPWFNQYGKLITVLPNDAFYGLASDYNKGEATYATLSHTHRFRDGGELKTSLRRGHFERDLLASAVRFGNGTTFNNLNNNTVVSRTPKGRIARTEGVLLQSDYSNKFKLGGLSHDLIAGLDLQQEKAKRANNFTTGLSFPSTTVGNADDGRHVADTRSTNVPFNGFTSRNLGLYAQNTLGLTPALKLIGGLRFDRFSASYKQSNGVNFGRDDNLWSPRVGALFQPSEAVSFHASYGTSYNVSGDTYQFTPGNPNAKDARTGPEKSRNVEVGSKLDLFEGKLSVNGALFFTQKYNERNTDPDSASTQQLLSGKRHATGIDLDVAGRITPEWEAYVSYTWIPLAKIDKSNATSGLKEGDRPGLTPKHSASFWNTYQVTQAWRVGAGLNHRSSQTPATTGAIRSKDFTTLDLMAEFKATQSTTLKLNVNNATDETYADALYTGFYTPGAPRSVQLSLKTQF